MSSENPESQDLFLPLGYSRTEGGGATLSAVEEIGPKCPKCNEGYIVNISKTSSWGKPSRPATAYCKKCNTSYTLGLKAQE